MSKLIALAATGLLVAGCSTPVTVNIGETADPSAPSPAASSSAASVETSPAPTPDPSPTSKEEIYLAKAAEILGVTEPSPEWEDAMLGALPDTACDLARSSQGEKLDWMDVLAIAGVEIDKQGGYANGIDGKQFVQLASIAVATFCPAYLPDEVKDAQ